MRGLGADFRSGDWVTAERVRGYSLIVLVLGMAMVAGLAVTASGIVDYQGRPLGTDFSNIYAAGKWVLAGRPEAPFDPALQHEMEKRLFGAETPFYGWHYPPMFLGVAVLLAFLPYLPALAVWQAATFAAYLTTIGGIVRSSPKLASEKRGFVWLLPAIAFPAVFINLTHGHNGFLTAALFGGGLLLLDRRPVIAGILIGLLCYKPQFGLLVPLVLIASARWRAFSAAAIAVIVAAALSWFAFGADTWLAFRDSLEFTRSIVLETGGTGFYKIQSPFAAVRMWGAPVEVAYAVQAAAVATVAVLLIILWRSEVAFALKAAALLTGSLLATPYVLDYDLMLMAPAIAFLAAHGLERGFLPYEKSLLAFGWAAPLLARVVAEYAAVPVGLIALLALFGIALRRSAADRAALPPL